MKIKSAKVIQVIEIRTIRGTGTESNPVREVTQYWDLDGRKLSEHDPEKDGMMVSQWG